MTYLQKLTDLVCQEKDIEKDLKEIKFWTELKDKSREDWSNLFYVATNVAWGWLLISSDEADDHCWYEVICWYKCRQIDEFENLWNQLEERHLRMYLKIKWTKYLEKQCPADEIFIINNFISNWIDDFLNYNFNYINSLLDDTKPLSQQSEEVLKNIFEALSS